MTGPIPDLAYHTVPILAELDDDNSAVETRRTAGVVQRSIFI